MDTNERTLRQVLGRRVKTRTVIKQYNRYHREQARDEKAWSASYGYMYQRRKLGTIYRYVSDNKARSLEGHSSRTFDKAFHHGSNYGMLQCGLTTSQAYIVKSRKRRKHRNEENNWRHAVHL